MFQTIINPGKPSTCCKYWVDEYVDVVKGNIGFKLWIAIASDILVILICLGYFRLRQRFSFSKALSIIVCLNLSLEMIMSQKINATDVTEEEALNAVFF